MQESIVHLLSTIVILFPAAFHNSYDKVSSLRFSNVFFFLSGDLIVYPCFIRVYLKRYSLQVEAIIASKIFSAKTSSNMLKVFTVLCIH